MPWAPLGRSPTVTSCSWYLFSSTPLVLETLSPSQDGYGSARSRTIEPTVTDKGSSYELMGSCIRVYRLQVRRVGGCSIA
jgi:hypothetical protein